MTTPEAQFNFSRVSARDALAFGSGRPGFPSQQVTSGEETPWIEFMKSRGIKRVLSLLGDDETEYYNFDIDTSMKQSFGETNYTRISVFSPEACEKMSAALAAAKEAGESVVIHCSGGGGRAALGMGLWLVDTYGLAPEDAAREIQEETDRNDGVNRKVNAAKLAYLVTEGSMTGFKK